MRRPAVSSRAARLHGLGSDQAVIEGGVLGGWQQRVRTATLPHVQEQLETAGILDNLRRVLDPSVGPFRGRYPFLDTDLHKTLEALAHTLGSGDAAPGARAFWDAAVELLESVQRADGYLGSWVQDPGAGREAFADLAFAHELYGLGHLVQAGVAGRRQLGEERLLAVARRFADLVVAELGPEGRDEVEGHPVVEMALVELFRETGHRPYLDTAAVMVARRGRGRLRTSRFGPEYFVDHVPVRDLRSVTGHAVRMVYLAAGATDVAIETGDADLLATMQRLWDDMVATRLFVTGGLGARHADEAIGDRYELASERAYAETCAAIGTMQWAWRLFLATGRADVLDVMETVQHNAFAAGTSLDGRAFLYDNPLQRRPDHSQQTGGELDGTELRRGWFVCACCPPNIARWVGQLQDHLAAFDDSTLYLAQYADATIDDGRLGVRTRTAYPWDQRVDLEVLRLTDPGRTLALRLPAWCRSWTLTTPAGGSWSDVEKSGGWLRVRGLVEGSRLALSLAMPVRMLASHPHVDATRGAVALARGPVVLCAEQVDQTAPVDDLVLDPADLAQATVHPQSALGGYRVDHSTVSMPAGVARPQRTGLYEEVPAEKDADADPDDARRAGKDAISATFVPYALWGNRDAGAMRVWLRRR